MNQDNGENVGSKGNEQAIREATERWLKDFSYIPMSLIHKLIKEDFESVELVAAPFKICPECEAPQEEIDSPDGEDNLFTCPCGWEGCEDEMYNHRPYDYPAMWGTVFVPKDPTDNWWLEQNAEQIAQVCNVYIYEHEDIGHFIAVDGAGYDFYDSHWVKMYKLRGLQWHNKHNPITSERE